MSRSAVRNLVRLAFLIGILLTTGETARSASDRQEHGGGVWEVLAPDPARVFYQPSGIAVDAGGNLYVLEAATNSVLRVSAAGQVLLAWGGTGSAAGRLSNPTDIALDHEGNVYVADANNERIQKFASNGRFLKLWGLGGVSTRYRTHVIKLAIDRQDNVYVFQNTGPAHLQLVKFTSRGKKLLRWTVRFRSKIDRRFRCDIARPGWCQGDLTLVPLAAVAGPKRNVHVLLEAVTCGGGYRVGGCRQYYFLQKRSPTGSVLSEQRLQGAWSRGGAVVPTGMSLDAQGHLLLIFHPLTSDSLASVNPILKLSSSGRVLAHLGSGGCGPARFRYPSGVATDARGNIYVADRDNGNIQKLAPSGHSAELWGGCPTAQFNDPFGITVDAKGNLYVADTGHELIQKLSRDGRLLSQWSVFPSGGNAPVAVAVDGQDYVYVLNVASANIQVFTAGGKLVRKWGERGPAPGQFDTPYGLAVSREGIVYVADSGNDRIQRFSSDGKLLAVWGGRSTQGDKLGQFDRPNGVTLDSHQNVYVADTGNARIQELSPSGQPLRQWIMPNQTRSSPLALAVDAASNLWVVDSGVNGIVQLSRGGQMLSRWNTLGVAPGQFQGPKSIAIDVRGNIYIVESGNNRVQTLSAGT